jgi:hypothetical protein
MNETETMWLLWAIEILSPLLLALMCLASAYVTAWIRRKIEHQQLESALIRLTNATDRAVRHTEQTLVRTLKRGAADGKLSATDAKAAAAAALATLEELAGPRGIAEADEILGGFDGWARRMIEARIDELKGAQK